MTVQQQVADLGFKVLNRIHHTVLRATGGRFMGKAFGMPVVELHTVGRRSGRPHSAMLTAPVVDGDRVVVVASKGGDDRPPDWYRNVLAHPEIDVTIEGTRRPMTAREATAEEKDVLWPRVVQSYRGYDRYQQRSSRDIPLVLLEPR